MSPSMQGVNTKHCTVLLTYNFAKSLLMVRESCGSFGCIVRGSWVRLSRTIGTIADKRMVLKRYRACANRVYRVDRLYRACNVPFNWYEFKENQRGPYSNYASLGLIINISKQF